MTAHHDPTPFLSAELAQHTDFLRSLARRLLRHEADADDLVQETMAIAVTSGPDSSASLRPWLATVLDRRSKNRIRDRTRQPRQGAVRSLDGLPGKSAVSQSTIELSKLLLREVEALRFQRRNRPHERVLLCAHRRRRPLSDRSRTRRAGCDPTQLWGHATAPRRRLEGQGRRHSARGVRDPRPAPLSARPFAGGTRRPRW